MIVRTVRGRRRAVRGRGHLRAHAAGSLVADEAGFTIVFALAAGAATLALVPALGGRGALVRRPALSPA
jgi:hypothetical protein